MAGVASSFGFSVMVVSEDSDPTDGAERARFLEPSLVPEGHASSSWGSILSSRISSTHRG